MGNWEMEPNENFYKLVKLTLQIGANCRSNISTSKQAKNCCFDKMRLHIVLITVVVVCVIAAAAVRLLVCWVYASKAGLLIECIVRSKLLESTKTVMKLSAIKDNHKFRVLFDIRLEVGGRLCELLQIQI